MTTLSGRLLGEARTYRDLHALLRARTDELRLSFETIDEHMKTLPDGYASKLLAPVPIRGLSQVSMGPILAALCVRLLVVEDCEALERLRRITRTISPAHARGGMLATKKGKKRRYFNVPPDWGRMMNGRRNILLSRRRRKRIATIAAKARWAKKSSRPTA